MTTDRAQPQRHEWLNALFVIASFAMAAAFYGRLPNPLPIHWNAEGVANRFTPKPWGPFVFPLLMAGLWLVLAILPRISPKGFGIEPFARSYGVLKTVLLGFLLLLATDVFATAMGGAVLHQQWVFFGLGMLCVIIGNYLGKVSRNFFVGIRTPWTLADEEVWLGTHRLAGKTVMLGGALTGALGLLLRGPASTFAVVPVVAGWLVPSVYSYFLYRRLRGSSSL
jgi:uncharacterized membrane protein